MPDENGNALPGEWNHWRFKKEQGIVAHGTTSMANLGKQLKVPGAEKVKKKKESESEEKPKKEEPTEGEELQFYTPKELADKFLVTELKAKAKELGLSGYSHMNEAQLCELLKNKVVNVEKNPLKE